jgi:signal transduction histidine kinase
LNTAPEKLFERFAKNNPESDSLGLGLAIVKQICANYQFDLRFTSENNIHTISISF